MIKKVYKRKGIRAHPLYTVWKNMRQRCYNKNYCKYHKYGGRGVTICDEWRADYEVFYNWAIMNGWSEGLELDKDKLAPNKQGLIYSPKYCSFITHKENCLYTRRSKHIEYKGVTKNLSVWCDELGLNYSNVIRRIFDSGWDIEKAFTTP